MIGLPHPDFGEGAALSGEASEPVIRAAVEAKPATVKRPKACCFADAPPRDTMGKVRKAALRKAHEAAFSC